MFLATDFQSHLKWHEKAGTRPSACPDFVRDVWAAPAPTLCS